MKLPASLPPIVIYPVRTPIALLIALVLLVAVPAAQKDGEVIAWHTISKITGGGPIGISVGDQFGRGAAMLGDVDDDGISDLAVGAPGDDGDGTGFNYGAVWILFMNADGTVKAYQKIGHDAGGWSGDLEFSDGFGRTVAGLGDFDGDGIPDLGVGVNYGDDGGPDKGEIWVFFLNSDGTVKHEQKISETHGGFTGILDDDDQFGRSVCSLGDVDGDGVDDILVGAMYDDDGGLNRGAVYVLFMNADATVKSHQKISQSEGGFLSQLSNRALFGFASAQIGDRDGDGIEEVVVSAVFLLVEGEQRGGVFVLSLNPDGTVKSNLRITEGYGGFTGDLDLEDEFGTCVGSIGDVDGDGWEDVAVGAGMDDDGGTGLNVDRGAMWILFLEQNGTVRAHQKISALEGNFDAPLDNSDRFGSSVAAPGDWDGNGIPDLFVGARFDDSGCGDCGAMYYLALGEGIEADFSCSPVIGTPPLTVQFTDESTGPIVGWEWDFGDGETSVEVDPEHTYVPEGSYTVSLTVTGDRGDTDELVLADHIVARTDDPNIVHYGCGVNPADSLTAPEGTPQVGTSMLFGLDNPLGTQGPDSLTVLVFSLAPDPAYPCGTLVAGRGMDGGDGELLLSIAPSDLIGRFEGENWMAPGEPAPLPLLIPANPGLIGLVVYCQGFILDPVGAGGVTMGLTGALELTLH